MNELKREIKRETRQSVTHWIHQEGLKQEVVTLHDCFFTYQPTLGGVNMLNNISYLNANGFRQYSTSGALPADSSPPQKAIWNTYAAMYKYYMTEEIILEFIPTR